MVSCSDPGIPDHGNRDGDVFTYGSQAVFTCSTGYNLQGEAVSMCQADGSWSDATPICQSKSYYDITYHILN